MVRPALHAMHRQHRRTATSLLVASGDAVFERPVCVCSSHGERRASLGPLRVWTAEAPEEPRPRKIRWFVAALVVSEGFEGPHCSCTAMADLLVQVSRVVTDYWGNDFEARRLTVRGRPGHF